MTTAMDSKMRVIEALLRTAAHEATPDHERVLAQEKADKLMIQYQIDRAMVNLDRDNDRKVEPIRKEYDKIDLVDRGSVQNTRDISEYFVQASLNGIKRSIFHHAGAVTTEKFLNGSHTFIAIGFPEDLVYAEMLWLSVFAEIVPKMFPTWEENRGFDENVYALKASGRSWPQVFEMAMRHGPTAKEELAESGFFYVTSESIGPSDKTGPLTKKNAASKLRTAYRRHAKSIGEEVSRQPSDPHWWRKSFAHAFETSLAQRIGAMKQGREEYFDKSNLPAMQHDADMVKAKFYEEFPEKNPANQPKPDPNVKPTKAVRRKERYADPNAWQAGHAAAHSVNLSNNKQFSRKEELE